MNTKSSIFLVLNPISFKLSINIKEGFYDNRDNLSIPFDSISIFTKSIKDLLYVHGLILGVNLTNPLYDQF